MDTSFEEFVVEHRGEKATIRLDKTDDGRWATTVLIQPKVGMDSGRKVPIANHSSRFGGYATYEAAKAGGISDAKADIDSLLDLE